MVCSMRASKPDWRAKATSVSRTMLWRWITRDQEHVCACRPKGSSMQPHACRLAPLRCWHGVWEPGAGKPRRTRRPYATTALGRVVAGEVGQADNQRPGSGWATSRCA
eukprot:4591271-Amphidinium_carterae.1